MHNIVFIEICCPICGSETCRNVYSSNQVVSTVLGMVRVDNVLCEECGLMYTNPVPEFATLKRHYEYSGSGDVYRETHENSRLRSLFQARANFVEKYIDRAKSGTLLDVGCGDGYFLQSLNIPQWKKIGIDPSFSSGRLIMDKDIAVHRSTIEEFQSMGVQYDVICCFSSLEHFFAPDSAIQNLTELLEDDGYIFIDVPDSTKPSPGIEEYYSLEHLTHFTKGTLSKLLMKSGLQIIEFDASTEQLPNILCVAGKRLNSIESSFVDDTDELLIALEAYKEARKTLVGKISERMIHNIRSWKETQSKVAIYGAGFHTNALMDIFDFSQILDCLIDSDPKKWNKSFMKWNIYPPQKIAEMNVQGIIISSHSFVEEISQTISRFNKNDIPVIKLYND